MGKHCIEADLQFRGLVHYCHGGKHGGMQADMVAEEVLYLDQQAAKGDCEAYLEHMRPQSLPSQ